MYGGQSGRPAGLTVDTQRVAPSTAFFFAAAHREARDAPMDQDEAGNGGLVAPATSKAHSVLLARRCRRMRCGSGVKATSVCSSVAKDLLFRLLRECGAKQHGKATCERTMGGASICTGTAQSSVVTSVEQQRPLSRGRYVVVAARVSVGGRATAQKGLALYRRMVDLSSIFQLKQLSFEI